MPSFAACFPAKKRATSRSPRAVHQQGTVRYAKVMPNPLDLLDANEVLTELKKIGG